MQQPEPQANTDQIEQFIRYITQGWDELDGNPMIEIRSISTTRQVHAARFALDWIDEAIDHAHRMNQAKQNIYMCINPVDAAHIPAGKGAKDTDIMAAMFCFADADTSGAMQNILSFAGPQFTMSVKTGTTPFVRGHAYWQLEEPCLNMDAWREVQRSIAASLNSDPAVINPSRIMRVAGTVSWPNQDKQAKGYVPELVTMRTEFNTDRDPVPFDRMMRAFPKTAKAETTGLTIDVGQQAMDRALAEQKISSGEDWHNNIIRLVASYIGKGLSDSEIHALTDRFTMPGYTVEDTRAEVQQAIDGARAKGWTPQPDPIAERMAAQVPAAPQIQLDEPQPAKQQDTWPTPLENINAAMLPKRQWVYAHHHIRQYLSVTASAGGVGKTSLLMIEGLSVATGRDLLGERVKEQTNVWFICLEDPRVELELRMAAAMQHYDIKYDDIAGRFFMDGEDTIEITLAAETRDGVTQNDELLAYMTRKIAENRIGLVIIDPMVSLHAVNENSNQQIQMVVAMLRKLARDTGAAVHLVHHVRKLGNEDATVDAVRGAGALIGAARAARVINKIKYDDALRLGFEPDQAKGLFRVDDAKANLSAPAEHAVYRRMIGVQIANEEYVGVATKIQLPDVFEGITAKDAAKVQRAVGQAAEEEPLRESVQAKRWVGHTIGMELNIDTEDETGKAKVKTILKKWLETDVLRVEMHPDKKRNRDIPCVLPGTWIYHEET